MQMQNDKYTMCKYLQSTLFLFKERDTAFYDRLYEALHLLVEFFSVNGNGLTGAKLHTDSYTRMELLYGLNKVTHRERIFS